MRLVGLKADADDFHPWPLAQKAIFDSGILLDEENSDPTQSTSFHESEDANTI